MARIKHYAISRHTSETRREVVDIFEDYDEAQLMLAEYRLSERKGLIQPLTADRLRLELREIELIHDKRGTLKVPGAF